MPVASGGIHIWHMPAGGYSDDSCLVGGGTLGHPWVMLLALLPTGLLWKLASKPVKAGLAREGNDVIREAAKWSPELAVACELWKKSSLSSKQWIPSRSQASLHSW